jgi:hypothetical protein
MRHAVTSLLAMLFGYALIRALLQDMEQFEACEGCETEFDADWKPGAER